MYKDTERNYKFYMGDQWFETNTGGDNLPQINFIKPTLKYKISMIAQNQMTINYTDMGAGGAGVTDALNEFAAKQWEKSKLDALMWGTIKRAAIAGDSYIYAHNRGNTGSVMDTAELAHQLINKTSIHFADEQNPNINEQAYIIIDERVSVKKARETARANGIPEDEVARIVKDEDAGTQIGEKAEAEVKSDDGKCMSILYMELVPEGLKFLRSSKSVIYEPESVIQGLNIYPIVGMRWEEIIGSARGASGVVQMIPNQREVNACAARRAIGAKRFAFPNVVYDTDRITNIEALDKVGASIGVKNLAQNPIKSFIDYLNPAPISSDAQNLQNELVEQTRNLEGAGDAATGQVDPTKASGEAIKASRDQAAVPLNEQIAAYKQLVEDLALMWYKLWLCYSPNGIRIKTANGENIAMPEQLKGLEINIKVDVSPVDPYSKISQEIALERLFTGQNITFDEYVQALDDTSTVPKLKLEAIIEQRQAEAKAMEESELMQTKERLMQAEEALAQLAQEQGLELPRQGGETEKQGGVVNEMPKMRP